MKRMFSLILALLLVLTVIGASAVSLQALSVDIAPGGATPDLFENRVIISYNRFKSFSGAASICYWSDGSPEPQYAEMEYLGKQEGYDWYGFTLPEEMDRFYFTDGTERTVEIYLDKSRYLSVEYSLFKTTDENGYFTADILAALPAPTEAPTEPADSPYRYKSRFDAIYGSHTSFNGWVYDELYYHENSRGETDYALVYAGDRDFEQWTAYAAVSNRVYVSETDYPFIFGLAVYDVEEGAFHSLLGNSGRYGYGYTDLTGSEEMSKYEDLASIVDEYGRGGRLLGDLDKDQQISIIDVTLMQRCEAGMREYPADDLIEPIGVEIGPEFRYVKLTYYSDFNRDGDRDIVDTTCIQRYLVGLPYMIG